MCLCGESFRLENGETRAEFLGSDSRFRDPLADGVSRELDTVMDVELVHEILSVIVDGLDADAHDRGDFLLRQPASKVPEDLDLSRCQRRDARGSLGGERSAVPESVLRLADF